MKNSTQELYNVLYNTHVNIAIIFLLVLGITNVRIIANFPCVSWLFSLLCSATFFHHTNKKKIKIKNKHIFIFMYIKWTIPTHNKCNIFSLDALEFIQIQYGNKIWKKKLFKFSCRLEHFFLCLWLPFVTCYPLLRRFVVETINSNQKKRATANKIQMKIPLERWTLRSTAKNRAHHHRLFFFYHII